MSKKPHYLNFPSKLMKGYFENKREVLETIISFAIMNYAINTKDIKKGSVKRLIYAYVNDRLSDDVLAMLEDVMSKSEVEPIDFSDLQEWSNEAEELLQVLYGEIIAYPDLEEYALKEQLKHRISKDMGINAGDKAYSIFKEIESQGLKGEPFSTMTKENAFAFRDEDKSEFEHMAHAICMGLYSILGKRKSAKTTVEFAMRRALGYKSLKCEVSEFDRALIQKYSTRRIWAKMVRFMKIEYNLLYYRGWGFYFSFTNKLSVENFAKEIEKSRAAKQKKVDKADEYLRKRLG